MSDLAAGWTATRLGEIAEVQLGKMLSAKSRTGIGARPYLRNVNIRWGRIDVRDMFEMDFDSREVAKYELKVGDVLVCEGGEPGRSAIWKNQLPGALYQKAIHRVRFRENVYSPVLFVYFMEWAALTGRLTSHLTGSTIKHIPRESFLLLDVLIPPVPEQGRIAAALEEHLSRLEAAISMLARVQPLFSDRAEGLAGQLRQSILSRAFAGTLVPQDSQDEPASVLLDRVRASRALGASQRVSRRRA